MILSPIFISKNHVNRKYLRNDDVLKNNNL